MHSETVENYLKALYALEQPGVPDAFDAGVDRAAGSGGGSPVPLGDLAAALGVVPGTVTAMVKRLAVERLVKYEPYGGVALSAKGRRVALSVLRRHRLVETFLVGALGMDWAEVHEEAERLEHALSDRLLDRLDEFLGRPARDPHGDPIPDAAGAMRGAGGGNLASAAAGATVTIARVLDQSAGFLHFLAEHGLKPGAEVTIVSSDARAETVRVRRGGGEVVLSRGAARKLQVE